MKPASNPNSGFRVQSKPSWTASCAPHSSTPALGIWSRQVSASSYETQPGDAFCNVCRLKSKLSKEGTTISTGQHHVLLISLHLPRQGTWAWEHISTNLQVYCNLTLQSCRFACGGCIGVCTCKRAGASPFCGFAISSFSTTGASSTAPLIGSNCGAPAEAAGAPSILDDP